MNEILRLHHIDKHFGGIHAVKDVSLSFTEGEVCALIGENGAGKSTLGKIIAGVHQPENGEMWFNNERMSALTPMQAQQKGIGLIFQELDLFPSLSAAMNIINNNITFNHLQRGLMSPVRIQKEVEPWLKKVRLDIPASMPLEQMSMAQVQLVSIARVLSMNARLIIMDEPTSSLTDDAVDNLFSLMEELKKDGVTIIYVSHKMNEIFRVADTIAVLRDGEFISKKHVSETNRDEVIEMMVGRPLSGNERQVCWKTNENILRVENLHGLGIEDISFDLNRGEVLGVAGLVGAGRSELGEALFGLVPARTGLIKVKGKVIKISSPLDAIREGIGFIPEDRKTQGLMMQLSVKENMILSYLDFLQRKGFLLREKINTAVNSLIERINIKSASADACVDTLSGGNQQKVLVSRWMMVNPEILFLDDPTRGVDVGAKEDIYELITRLAAEGKGVIFVSSELPELLRCCDRIMVMSEGRISALLDAEKTTQKEIMSFATKTSA
jgi:ABC-type sugar transport system ATPase subunit